MTPPVSPAGSADFDKGEKEFVDPDLNTAVKFMLSEMEEQEKREERPVDVNAASYSSFQPIVDDVESIGPSTEKPANFMRSYRMFVVFLLSFLLFCTTSLRMNLGMAMVCMVNSTAFTKPVVHRETLSMATNVSAIGLNDNDECVRSYDDDYAESHSLGYQGTLLWNPVMQSQLFGAVFYGSLVTIFLAGYMADRLGPKILLAGALTDYVLMTLVSPYLAHTDYRLFFASRVLMGIGEGFVYPSLSATSTRWFPPSERSRSAALFTVGNQISSVIGNLVSSRLCALSFLGGWPLIFYLFGCIGLVALILWLVFFTDSPTTNTWISASERKHIESVTTSQWLATAVPTIAPSMAAPTEKDERTVVVTVSGRCAQECDATEKRSSGVLEIKNVHSKRLSHGSIPWRSIITCPPLYACICGQASFNFSAVMLQSYLPTYAKEVLQLGIEDNGLLSIVPFFIQLISKISYGCLSDWLKKRKILTSTKAAKLFQTIGNFGCCLTFLGLAYTVNCNRVAWATFLLAFYGATFSAGIAGFFTSMLSIAPAHSGLITSITTFFGIIANASAPFVVSLIHKTGDASEWRIIWTIVAAINFVAGASFLLFGSAEIQPWARPKSTSSLGGDEFTTKFDKAAEARIR